MPNNAHNIGRFLAAHEGGSGVYPRGVMDWLAKGLRKFQIDPATGLEKALGLCSVNRRSQILERGNALRAHCEVYEAKKSRYAAAMDMADNLQLLARDHNDTNIPPQYRLLFDKLSALGLRMPKHDTIYTEIRKI